MEINRKTFKHCDLITIQGRVDSSTAPQLSEIVKASLEAGHYKVVLDLTGLEFISSAGLWVLVNAQKSCKRYNRGEVILASTPPKILSTLDLAGFIPYFTMYDSVTEAVGAF